MATLWVGTRKGLFRYDQGAADQSHTDQGRTWAQVGKPAFLAAPVTFVLDDPRDGALFVALSHGHFGCKLHRSEDRGASWVELPAPAFPLSDAPDAPALELIWSIVPGGADQPGVLWAGTIPGGCSGQTTAAQAGRSAPGCGTGQSAPAGWAAAMITPAFTRFWLIRETAPM